MRDREHPGAHTLREARTASVLASYYVEDASILIERDRDRDGEKKRQ